MRTHMAWLAILCLALGAIPALAQWTYNNGPVNGTTDAWTINFGFVVSDNFEANGNSINNVSFGTWEISGDAVTSVSWTITGGENSGAMFGSGTTSGSNLTDTFISSNQYSYDVDKVSLSNLGVSGLTSGATYWLNLVNATTKEGEPVYWDENSGVGCGGIGHGVGCPSLASENEEGTIPSEAFTIGSVEPEPGSFLLLATGILGVAGVLRRRLL